MQSLWAQYQFWVLSAASRCYALHDPESGVVTAVPSGIPGADLSGPDIRLRQYHQHQAVVGCTIQGERRS